MCFKEFMDFQEIFQRLTGECLTQEQINEYEKWQQERFDHLKFSVGEAIINLQCAWNVLEVDQPHNMDNISYKKMYTIFEWVEKSRNLLETYQKSYE